MVVLGVRRADELTQRTGRPQHFRAYLFGIARNQILRRFQERHADRSLEELSRTPAARWLESPTSHVRKREHRHELLEALKQLPTDVQLTLQLHYWADLSVDDIAQITDVATGTVRSRLTRGRQTLSTLLGDPATAG